MARDGEKLLALSGRSGGDERASERTKEEEEEEPDAAGMDAGEGWGQCVCAAVRAARA